MKALITGASEGIGKAFAEALVARGYTVTVVARNTRKLQEFVQSQPTASHESHLALTADLCTDRGIEETAKLLETGGYNLLINNAGFGMLGKFVDLDIEQSLKMVELNCKAVVKLSHAFLKSAQPGAALINVASTAAFHALPNNGLYAATKALVLSFTEALHSELKPKGIFAMALCPGYTITEFAKRAGSDDNPAFKKFSQTPAQVVDVALKALDKRSSPIVISGLQNKAMAYAQGLLPRSVTRSLAGVAMDKFRNV